ncbi:MAG: tRNA (adenosine(37)-N6)-threonylcarbamoyltransferase complex dimerization subunit type 1 TsaB [Bdellovibrionales bacterium]|nr:tRNA (adenosine(37)-N6)-threonylcarbamoyltransferase complex dimerization subunit type 1 TsaB [Bdellovibrionales bacterium]
MSYLLVFDCSLPTASLAVLRKKDLKCLVEKKWIAKAPTSSHSDLLPLKMSQALEEVKLCLKSLSSLIVGVGPGRFTGVRTGLCVAKALAYSLTIPVYPINSLRLIAKSFSDSKNVCVALQAFKNQVYYGEFLNQELLTLLTFESWEKKMKSFREPVVCLSDLEDFYPFKKENFSKVDFKKPQISSLALAEIAYRENICPLTWNKLKANYMRSHF